MKKLVALTLLSTMALSTMVFAETHTMGNISTSYSYKPRVELNLDKVSEEITKSKPVLMAGRPVVVQEPKIIMAETLPELNLSKFLYEPEVRPLEKGLSVTITKDELMKSDLLLMEGLAIKNLRKIATHPQGGDIYAIDIMRLEGDIDHITGEMSTRMLGSTRGANGIQIKMKKTEGINYVTHGTQTGNMSKNVPVLEGSEVAILKNGTTNMEKYTFGAFQTYIIGNLNKLGGSLHGVLHWEGGYSTKDMESVIIYTSPYHEYVDRYTVQGEQLSDIGSSEGKATQLIITGW